MRLDPTKPGGCLDPFKPFKPLDRLPICVPFKPLDRLPLYVEERQEQADIEMPFWFVAAGAGAAAAVTWGLASLGGAP